MIGEVDFVCLDGDGWLVVVSVWLGVFNGCVGGGFGVFFVVL